eukprot:SAG31_NODE_993_length_10512_cov_20.777202_2_plen_142_part_00
MILQARARVASHLADRSQRAAPLNGSQPERVARRCSPVHPVNHDDRDWEPARNIAAGDVQDLGLIAVPVLALDEPGRVEWHLGRVPNRIDVVVQQLRVDRRARFRLRAVCGRDPEVLQGDTFSISPGFLGAYMGDSARKVP